jgi:hypothetical protein
MDNHIALTRAELEAIEQTASPNFVGADIGTIVAAAIPYVFGFAGFALLIYIVFAGFTLLMSRGDQKGVAAAQANLTYAIVGFIIVFASYWIVQIVGRVLGITQFQTIFG